MPDLSDQLARARHEGGAYALPPRTLVKLTGVDAFRYLNGQITKDLGRAPEGGWTPACILSPKGRLCALLQVSREGGDILVECDPGVVEELLVRLERYIVADDVAVSAAPAPPAIHVFGRAAGSASLSSSGIIRMGEPGYDISPENPQMLELLSPSVVETLRIERGVPAWGRELNSETLPPEAGLDRTCIDYDRGCYPGQEVISRLKSIGRVNRLLTGFVAGETGGLLAPGMTIAAGERGGSGSVGRITSAIMPPDGSPCVALGYLPRGAEGPFFALDPLTGGRTPLSIVTTYGT
jgi:folate-binding protein YgfZ